MIAVLTGFVHVHFTMSYMKKKQYVLKWALSTSVCLYFARAESIVGGKLFFFMCPGADKSGRVHRLEVRALLYHYIVYEYTL